MIAVSVPPRRTNEAPSRSRMTADNTAEPARQVSVGVASVNATNLSISPSSSAAFPTTTAASTTTTTTRTASSKDEVAKQGLPAKKSLWNDASAATSVDSVSETGSSNSRGSSTASLSCSSASSREASLSPVPGGSSGDRKGGDSNDRDGFSEKDILFGRGKSMVRDRPSSKVFLDFVDAHRGEYRDARGKAERDRIANRVVESLRECGHAILKPTGGDAAAECCDDDDEEAALEEEDFLTDDHSRWVEASPEEIRNRVTFLLRQFRSVSVTDKPTDDEGQAPKRSVQTVSAKDATEKFSQPPTDFSFSSSLLSAEQPLEANESAGAAQSQSRELARWRQIRLRDGEDSDMNKRKNDDSDCSAFRDDGVLWSNQKGTKKIKLLPGMDSDLIPTTSFCLLPTVGKDVFTDSTGEGKKMVAGQEQQIRQQKEEEEYQTIGYSEQKVGDITIVRPIILLPTTATRTTRKSAGTVNSLRSSGCNHNRAIDSANSSKPARATMGAA